MRGPMESVCHFKRSFVGLNIPHNSPTWNIRHVWRFDKIRFDLISQHHCTPYWNSWLIHALHLPDSVCICIMTRCAKKNYQNRQSNRKFAILISCLVLTWKVNKSFCHPYTWSPWWCGPFWCFAIKHRVLITYNSFYSFPCTPDCSHIQRVSPWICLCINTVSYP